METIEFYKGLPESKIGEYSVLPNIYFDDITQEAIGLQNIIDKLELADFLNGGNAVFNGSQEAGRDEVHH